MAKGEQAAAYVLEAYCRSSRDMVSERLLDFYRSRRAMVRAKILAWNVCDAAVMNLAPWWEHVYEHLRVSQRYADRAVGAATARD
jgi:aminoglycoside phosphotransferase family enzyme